MAQTANKHDIAILLATETDYTVILFFRTGFSTAFIGVWIIHNT